MRERVIKRKKPIDDEDAIKEFLGEAFGDHTQGGLVDLNVLLRQEHLETPTKETVTNDDDDKDDDTTSIGSKLFENSNNDDDVSFLLLFVSGYNTNLLIFLLHLKRIKPINNIKVFNDVPFLLVQLIQHVY